MQYYGMTLNLRNDPSFIERYRAEHHHIWPAVVARLREVGVTQMRIFLRGRRLFMYMETVDGFQPARDFARLDDDQRYREWDELMRSMQERAAEAGPDEWWAEMEPVFDLNWSEEESR